MSDICEQKKYVNPRKTCRVCLLSFESRSELFRHLDKNPVHSYSEQEMKICIKDIKNKMAEYFKEEDELMSTCDEMVEKIQTVEKLLQVLKDAYTDTSIKLDDVSGKIDDEMEIYREISGNCKRFAMDNIRNGFKKEGSVSGGCSTK